jgi:hypothetical protein
MVIVKRVSSAPWISSVKADETGNKCKFSHDPNVGRKVEKVNLYEDTREDKKKGEVNAWLYGRKLTGQTT